MKYKETEIRNKKPIDPKICSFKSGQTNISKMPKITQSKFDSLKELQQIQERYRVLYNDIQKESQK